MKWLGIFFLCSSFMAYGSKLVVGTSSFYPPYEVEDAQNNFSGFDVELVKQICMKMNVDCIFKSMLFSDLFFNIDKGNIDIAIGAIYHSPIWGPNYLFSLPYLPVSSSFVVLADSSFHSRENIKKISVGVLKGGVSELLLIDAQHEDSKITRYMLVTDMIEDLMHGKIGAILIDTHAANYWTSTTEDALRIVGTPLTFDQGYSIMTSKNNESLINRINRAMLEIEDDGAYKSLYDNYF